MAANYTPIRDLLGRSNAPDRRVDELVSAGQRSARTSQGDRPLEDPQRALAFSDQRLGTGDVILLGTVVCALPAVNWYRVQLGVAGGTVSCCNLYTGSFNPSGVRSTALLPPNSSVLVYLSPGQPWGVILGVLPRLTTDLGLFLPDRVWQAGGSGFHREDAYLAPFNKFDVRAGLHNFNAGRPLDSTSLDWGHMAETGVGVHVDPYMAYLRVSEMCGLFINYFDQYTRLAGLNLDIQTPPFDLVIRNDEGEHQMTAGQCIYPWEAMGLLWPNTSGDNYTEHPPSDVQYNRPVAPIDLPEQYPDLTPVHRVREYGGYLGQGGLRYVSAPYRPDGELTGYRRHSDDPRTGGTQDIGLFREQIGLDGSYLVQSAHSLTLSKRILIPVPHQQRLPEDQAEGDDRRKGNYNASGAFGGDPHRVREPELTLDADHNLRRLASMQDWLAHTFNWRGLHPFHYHKLDYVVPDEQHLAQYTPFSRAQDRLDFSQLRYRNQLSAPSPRNLRIDHRYGQVNYYQREAYVSLLPDGGITLGDGYGAQITLSGGHIQLDCPGDIRLNPGRNLVSLGGNDIVLRARKSLDATAGTGDLRLKAERNLQMLGGNQGNGGVLIESKGRGMGQMYADRVGEDVVGSGVVIKTDGGIGLLGGSLYARTGQWDDSGQVTAGGDIILDASQGERQVLIKAGNVETFVRGGMGIYVGPEGDSSTITNCTFFGRSTTTLGSYTMINGALTALGPGMFDGHIGATGMIGSAVPQRFVGQYREESLVALSTFFQMTQSALGAFRAGQQTRHDRLFAGWLYLPGMPGNSETLTQIAFSYRDDDGHFQYSTLDFAMPESRWHTLLRQNNDESTLPTWQEPVVRYQGRELMPWPGKQQWEGETLIRSPQTVLYDPETGLLRERGEAYEQTQLGDLERVSLADNYRVVSR